MTHYVYNNDQVNFNMNTSSDRKQHLFAPDLVELALLYHRLARHLALLLASQRVELVLAASRELVTQSQRLTLLVVVEPLRQVRQLLLMRRHQLSAG